VIRKIIITPKFNATEIWHKTIQADWFDFQIHANKAGDALLHYMKTFINNNCKRTGSTGKLENAIDIKHLKGFGSGAIEWGIGDMSVLNAQAKHWHVINYGKKVGGEPFIPGGGQYRPVQFQDGPADPAKRGTGNSKAIAFKKIEGPNERKPSPVRPMNYIEATQRRLVIYMETLLRKFGKYSHTTSS
jgi:hypothetical protein